MIKKVKQALGNGEGCRVCYSSTGSYLIDRMALQVVIVNAFYSIANKAVPTIFTGLWDVGCAEGGW